jgi:hypothetical protein
MCGRSSQRARFGDVSLARSETEPTDCAPDDQTPFFEIRHVFRWYRIGICVPGCEIFAGDVSSKIDGDDRGAVELDVFESFGFAEGSGYDSLPFTGDMRGITITIGEMLYGKFGQVFDSEAGVFGSELGIFEFQGAFICIEAALGAQFAGLSGSILQNDEGMRLKGEEIAMKLLMGSDELGELALERSGEFERVDFDGELESGENGIVHPMISS